jgi:hypothetical protein
MVLLLRLVVLVVVVIWRLCWRSKRPRPSGELDGRPLFVVLKRKPKSKELEGFRLGVEFPAPVLLSMHREQPSDRWFKALGLSREIQTGDEAFDCLVYVACDHGGVHELLQHSARLRAAIRAVFEAGFQSVRHDGLALWIDRTSRAEPSDEDKALLTRLAHELRDLDRWLAMRRAPFRWRAIGCEGLAWGLVGFGVASFPFAMLSLQASLATGTLLLLGLGGALAGFLVCEGAVVALLRGSSRARFVLIECSVLFALSLPVVGVQTIADVNEKLGTVTHATGQRTVLDRERRTTGTGKRRRTVHRFTLNDGAPIGGYAIPRVISVSGSLYAKVQTGEPIDIVVSQGSLGLPWIEYRETAAARDPVTAPPGSG